MSIFWIKNRQRSGWKYKILQIGGGKRKNREVAVIVTAVYEFENIKANLKNNNYINIYSILDIILEA